LTAAFNAALAVFACFLLELSQSREQNRARDLDFINELATKLRLAIDVTERVGNDALQARRVVGVLTKLITITNTVFRTTQKPPENINGEAVLSARHLHSGVGLREYPQGGTSQAIEINQHASFPATIHQGVAGAGLDEYGSEIFTAFDGLTADWNTLDLSTLTPFDSMGQSDVPNIWM
jgi:hypothetical protein